MEEDKLSKAIDLLISEVKIYDQYYCLATSQALKTVLNELDRLQKENNRLIYENYRLKTIRYTTAFGTESIHLIPESDLVEINTNRYMIEIENGRFVDLKQVYQENVKLKKENEELKNEIMEKELEIVGKEEYTKASMGEIIEQYYTANEDCITKQKIEKLIEELKQDDINMTRKYKEKKNITGELLGIDKVRVRAYREKTREINEKLHKLLIETKGK